MTGHAVRGLVLLALGLVPAALGGCVARGNPRDDAPILLFTGTGTSPNDVGAIERILQDSQLDYAIASSSTLNEMDAARLRTYRLVIVPGGNFEEIGNSLTASTSANLRDAVRSGVNYLGICAGGFFAGNSPYNGLNLTSGVRFGFYTAGKPGVRKAAVTITTHGWPPLDHYWEDGPEFSGWGAVVGTYPDGRPAIVEGAVGRGWVVLTGVHPEAPESWRNNMTFRTTAAVDNAYAATLIRAALGREPLAPAASPR